MFKPQLSFRSVLTMATVLSVALFSNTALANTASKNNIKANNALHHTKHQAHFIKAHHIKAHTKHSKKYKKYQIRKYTPKKNMLHNYLYQELPLVPALNYYAAVKQADLLLKKYHYISAENPMITDVLTALVQDAHANTLPLLKKFFAKGFYSSFLNSDNNTLLIEAIVHANKHTPQIVKYLIEREEANINTQGKYHVDALLATFIKPNVAKMQILDYLLYRGAKANKVYESGEQPLIIAAKYAPYSYKHKIMQILLKHRANVNQIDGEGNNALLLELDQRQSLPIIKTLIRHRINLNQANASQQGAMYMALTNKYYNLNTISTILRSGAKIDAESIRIVRMPTTEKSLKTLIKRNLRACSAESYDCNLRYNHVELMSTDLVLANS